MIVLKKIGKYTLTFLVIISIVMILLTLACLFPSSLIKENVKKSSEALVKEGNRKIYYSIANFSYHQFDNYTDALMINIACSVDNEQPMYSAFVARKNYIKGVTEKITEDYVGDLKSSSKYEYLDQVHELNDTANGDAKESFEYARYWHGDLIFLRPLLLLFDYNQIRIINTIILVLLAIYLLVLVNKKFGGILANILFISLFIIDYFYIGLSIMCMPNIIIMMVFAIYLIKNDKNIKDYGILFFIVRKYN